MKTADALREALADQREAVNVLRGKRLTREAEVAESVVEAIAPLAEEFTTWLSEDDAEIRSGYAERTIRKEFRWLHLCGLARYNPKTGKREYLMCAVPLRTALQSAYADGRAHPVPEL